MQEVAHRPLVVYKYNMLAHVGAVSSFEVRPDRAKWPGCYYSMASVRDSARHDEPPSRHLEVSHVTPPELRSASLMRGGAAGVVAQHG